MNDKINLNYLENYAQAFSNKVCSEYFGTKKYMSGQEIIQLTPNSQVNFMIIKTLFEKWQEELEKLKSNPFFDYRDMAVASALKEFMDVLSRAIKVERAHFEPMMEVAVIDTVLLALDPMVYLWGEIEKATSPHPAEHLKASKKYIKWHGNLLTELLERGGQADADTLKNELSKAYEKLQAELTPAKELLASLSQVLPIAWDELLPAVEELTAQSAVDAEEIVPGKQDKGEEDALAQEVQDEEQEELPISERKEVTVGAAEGNIDPALAWAKFESEQSGLLKGPIDSLEDGVAINQRFMFTKKLFDGNPDLMGHAFKSIDQCDSFVEAIDLVNARYLTELSWDKESEEVHEFLHLIYRKFDEK
ncbi:hypothetical protein KZP23_04350 [Echinicola marina]|uniref:hypothetical protein n=1 Tax=Echinicola marina TaxID=2859768 RepID=UPI001CF6061A|nr:hypothetical protein [Echinicola marina]UCS94270.1 hypothetical protein KZP23_04350 [Echinicola marina]